MFSLLALAPDGSVDNSQISAGFKSCFRTFGQRPGASASTPIATILRGLLEGPEGVDLVRGLKLLFLNLSVRYSSKFSFFSWHWACQHFLQLLTAPTDGTDLFRQRLDTMEALEEGVLRHSGGDSVVLPFFETWWLFIRYVLKYGSEHAKAPHSKLDATMPILFELIAIVFSKFCDAGSFLESVLARNEIWSPDLMRWRNSSSAPPTRRKWLEAVVQIVKQIRLRGVDLEALFVVGLREVVKDASFGDERLALVPYIPVDGIGNLGWTSPLSDLPKRVSPPARIQSKLTFSPIKTFEGNAAIEFIDDDDDFETRVPKKEVVVLIPRTARRGQSSSQRLDFFFSVRNDPDPTQSRFEQRNSNTLALLHSMAPAPSYKQPQPILPPKLPARRIPKTLVAPVKPNLPPEKSLTAEDRLKELEMQRSAAGSGAKRATRVLVEQIDTRALGPNAEVARKAHRKLMAPSVDDLLKKIVSWTLNSLNANVPPDRELSASELRSIPQSFEDAEHYAHTFQPLLLMEFWGQLKQATEEDAEGQITVTMSMVPAGTQSKGAFDLFIFGRTEHGMQVNDLVVVSPSVEAPKTGRPQPVPSVLAKVEKMGPEGKDFPGHLHLKCKFFLPADGSDQQRILRTMLRGNKVGSFKLKRIVNMATMLREYQALMRFRNMAASQSNVFVRAVLKPGPVRPPNQLLERDPVLLRHFSSRDTFNAEQLGAIRDAVTSTGCTLIQGPPGTGKTKTIVALIAALLDEFQQPVLVCAPSNAAVDEIVSRLLDGIPTVRRLPEKMDPNSDDVRLSSPVDFKPRVVRVVLGQASKKTRVDVEAVTLERLIQKKIDQEQKEIDNEKALAMEKEILEEAVDAVRDKGLPARSREVKLPGRRARVDERTRRKELKYSIIAGAQIVCATLSTSGRKMIRENWFQSIIIDEAAQAVEISTIIPLTDRTRRCIMVGDPNQLPATVLSKEAKNMQYEQSLFARMMKSGYPTRMLTTQYRMHPEIREFPSEHFYEGRLQDGPQDRSRDWHSIPIFSPFVFFDLASSSQSGRRSLANPEEARFIAKLLDLLRDSFPPSEDPILADERNWSKAVGVITPYQEQRALLSRVLSGYPGMDIGTVDGFQGREKDIIVLSTVRSHQHGIGFLSDVRRLNVAITRAKSTLWIAGNSLTLSQNPHWKSLIDFAKEQDGRCQFCL